MADHECDFATAVSKPVEGFYQSPLLGLDSIRLVGGVERAYCATCDALLGTSFWKMGPMTAVIGSALCAKEAPWTWPEARLVRKWLGVQTKAVAHAAKVSAFDLEQLERGKGENHHTLLKVEAMLRLKAHLDNRVDGKSKYCDPLIIRYEDGEWVARGE